MWLERVGAFSSFPCFCLGQWSWLVWKDRGSIREWIIKITFEFSSRKKNKLASLKNYFLLKFLKRKRNTVFNLPYVTSFVVVYENVEKLNNVVLSFR